MVVLPAISWVPRLLQIIIYSGVVGKLPSVWAVLGTFSHHMNSIHEYIYTSHSAKIGQNYNTLLFFHLEHTIKLLLPKYAQRQGSIVV